MIHVLHKKVEVLSDDELIITPIDKIWDSFFNNNENQVSDDFFSNGRDNDIQPERESFDD